MNLSDWPPLIWEIRSCPRINWTYSGHQWSMNPLTSVPFSSMWSLFGTLIPLERWGEVTDVHKDMAESLASRCCMDVCKEIDRRFPEPAFLTIFKIFDPSSVLHDRQQLKQHGDGEVRPLSELGSSAPNQHWVCSSSRKAGHWIQRLSHSGRRLPENVSKPDLLLLPQPLLRVNL